jgi:DNA processing protein
MISQPPRTTRALSAEERIDWLRLIRTENVGPVTFFQMLERYGGAQAAIAAIPGLSVRGGRAKPLRPVPKAAAEREIERLTALGARLVAWPEADYPPLLTEIYDPPPVVTLLGHPHLLQKETVAVVGARNASVAGRRFARKIAAELGKHGRLVASGLARGIDTAAHEGALDSGTLAVIAGSIDVVYPEENRGLYEAIAERGLILAESPIGAVPRPRDFPRRNRLIAGVARGTVIVEAAARSGSLITARLAAEQGREVFAVPGSPLDPRARGCNGLIRQGAVLTEAAADVIEALEALRSTPLKERKSPEYAVPPAPPPNDSDLAGAREAVLAGLGATPVTVDELVRECQFSHAVVSTVLLELELADRLDRQPGNRVSLV